MSGCRSAGDSFVSCAFAVNALLIVAELM